jgi:hypothetical protein
LLFQRALGNNPFSQLFRLSTDGNLTGKRQNLSRINHLPQARLMSFFLWLFPAYGNNFVNCRITRQGRWVAIRAERPQRPGQH